MGKYVQVSPRRKSGIRQVAQALLRIQCLDHSDYARAVWGAKYVAVISFELFVSHVE